MSKSAAARALQQAYSQLDLSALVDSAAKDAGLEEEAAPASEPSPRMSSMKPPPNCAGGRRGREKGGRMAALKEWILFYFSGHSWPGGRQGQKSGGMAASSQWLAFYFSGLLAGREGSSALSRTHTRKRCRREAAWRGGSIVTHSHTRYWREGRHPLPLEAHKTVARRVW